MPGIGKSSLRDLRYRNATQLQYQKIKCLVLYCTTIKREELSMREKATKYLQSAAKPSLHAILRQVKNLWVNNEWYEHRT
jgi:hypothetical protein